jgi:hypothetical protein
MTWKPLRESWQSWRRRCEEADRWREARDPAADRVSWPMGCLLCLLLLAGVGVIGVAVMIVVTELFG